eukprot:1178074-Prorocentrum_minimum.AAC.11
MALCNTRGSLRESLGRPLLSLTSRTDSDSPATLQPRHPYARMVTPCIVTPPSPCVTLKPCNYVILTPVWSPPGWDRGGDHMGVRPVERAGRPQGPVASCAAPGTGLGRAAADATSVGGSGGGGRAPRDLLCGPLHQRFSFLGSRTVSPCAAALSAPSTPFTPSVPPQPLPSGSVRGRRLAGSARIAAVPRGPVRASPRAPPPPCGGGGGAPPPAHPRRHQGAPLAGEFTHHTGEFTYHIGEFSRPQGNSPISQENPSITQGNSPIPQGNSPVPQGNSNVPQGNPPITHGNSPIPQGNLPITQGNLPIPQGNTPTP